MTLNPERSRLRCAGYIFNLVCTAILFGVNNEALKDAEFDFSQTHDDSTLGTQVVTEFESVVAYGSEEQQHRAWQFKGLVGKLYNLVIHIKANNSRIAIFKSKQAQVNLENKGESYYQRILRLVTNGGIRWNSTYLIIDRAIFLRDALTLYQSYEQDNMAEEDLLTRED